MDTPPAPPPEERSPGRRQRFDQARYDSALTCAFAIVAVTFLWLLITGYLFLSTISEGLCALALPCSAEELARQDRLERLTVTALLVGPVVIAVVAFVLRMWKTGWAYVFVAIVLGIAVLMYSVYSSATAPTPADAEPSHSNVCIERSGGDTRCPGG